MAEESAASWVAYRASSGEVGTRGTGQANGSSCVQKLAASLSWWILLIVVSKDGKQLACISNSCPHLGTPLETGLIERRPIAGSASQKPGVADDGCEDCIVCPTHNTAFALASGEVRGEWCPYPPVIGSMMGAVKTQQNLPTFQIRARGKNIEVRLASSLDDGNDS